MSKRKDVRAELIQRCEDGVIDWQTLAITAVGAMSRAEVEDMAWSDFDLDCDDDDSDDE